MGYYDEMLRADNDATHQKFIKKLQATRDDIVAFVNDQLGWEGAGQYHCWLKGSFNIGYVIKRPGRSGSNGDGRPSSAFIRFPILGRIYVPWSAEKVKNEVMVLEYLHGVRPSRALDNSRPSSSWTTWMGLAWISF